MYYGMSGLCGSISSGPDASKHFPSTIVSYSAYPLASVANSKHTWACPQSQSHSGTHTS